MKNHLHLLVFFLFLELVFAHRILTISNVLNLREQLQQQFDDLRQQKEDSQKRIEELMSKLVTTEGSLQEKTKTAVEEDEKRIQELRQELESQRNAQREEENKVLKSLQEQLRDTKTKLEEQQSENTKLRLNVQGLMDDLETQKNTNESQQEEIQQLTQKILELEKLEEENEGIGAATRQKLETYANESEKWRHMIMQQAQNALQQLESENLPPNEHNIAQAELASPQLTSASSNDTGLYQELKKLRQDKLQHERMVKKYQHLENKLKEAKLEIKNLEQKVEESHQQSERRMEHTRLHNTAQHVRRNP